jgi:predicted DNA-binding transcriptional regulator AlpA
MAEDNKVRILNIEDYKRKIRNSKPEPTYSERWLNTRDLHEKLNTSRSTVYRKLAGGQLPKPKYWGKSPKWLESEIDAWMTSTKENL